MPTIIKKLQVFLLSALGAVLLLQTDISPTLAESFDEALALHNIARYGNKKPGDKDYVGRTWQQRHCTMPLKFLKNLEDVEPVDPRVIALLGSCYSIAARDLNSINFFKRSSDIKKGLAYIDQALEMAPDDIVVRLIRTAVQVHVPETRFVEETLGRNEAALKEMVILDELFKDEKLPDIADDMLILYQKMKKNYQTMIGPKE